MTLTLTAWNTIGLSIWFGGTWAPSQNLVVPNNFSSTYSNTSPVVFSNGQFFTVQQLRTSCGFSSGPQIFNGAGTLSYKMQRQGWPAQPVRTLQVGKTLSSLGITRGIHIGWVEWTPNACAKNLCVTGWWGRRCGLVATKSYPVQVWVQ